MAYRQWYIRCADERVTSLRAIRTCTEMSLASLFSRHGCGLDVFCRPALPSAACDTLCQLANYVPVRHTRRFAGEAQILKVGLQAVSLFDAPQTDRVYMHTFDVDASEFTFMYRQ